MTLEVVHRHEKLVPESDVGCMVPISGACVRGLMIRRSDDVCRIRSTPDHSP